MRRLSEISLHFSTQRLGLPKARPQAESAAGLTVGLTGLACHGLRVPGGPTRDWVTELSRRPGESVQPGPVSDVVGARALEPSQWYDWQIRCLAILL